jgi:serine/threonine protein kinase
MWTRTLFEAKDETRDPGLPGRRSRHVDSDDDAAVTNVEALPYDDMPVATTTKVSSSDIVNGDVSGSTSVIDMRDPVTLTEFDVNSKVAPIDTGPELVVYDDEVGGPFTGMLISNRYRLESRIGTGGFGVVFDAYDREADKRVAVKVLSPALSEDKRALMRFRREAIAVSRLEHPGIVSISDFGIEDEGVSYIVMEFLPGRDVAALLEDERYLSSRRAATLVMQCAEALTAAHVEGVLHRDLKPANIFVIQTKDLVERIKIIDFGIAKDRSSNPRMKDITAASKVVGTPFYMSPEQASGHELDGRADVYSLGVIRPSKGPPSTTSSLRMEKPSASNHPECARSFGAKIPWTRSYSGPSQRSETSASSPWMTLLRHCATISRRALVDTPARVVCASTDRWKASGPPAAR